MDENLLTPTNTKKNRPNQKDRDNVFTCMFKEECVIYFIS